MRLIATLFDTREPVSADAIRGWFPDYDEVSQDAFERTFERDKAVLSELGIPLRQESSREMT